MHHRRLRISVIGPLSVHDGQGVGLTPEGGLQRRLLALLVLRRGEVYGVSTTRHARRMGLARELTLRAMTAARYDGARTAVLHSSTMATSLYRSLGFEQIAEFRLLNRPGALQL